MLMNKMKSEVYKLNHSLLFWLHLILPILVANVFILYYRVSTWEEIEKINGYIQIISISFPLIIGIITVIAAEQEEQAGAFYPVLYTNSKIKTHLSKLAIILLYGLFSAMIAVIGFGILFRFIGSDLVSIFDYFMVALMVFIATLPIYIIHYLVAFAFGKSAGTILGIFGSLFSALLLTGLGDGLWMVLPWGILARSGSLYLQSKFYGVSILSLISNKIGIIFLLIICMILTAVFILWANKWEGRESIDS